MSDIVSELPEPINTPKLRAVYDQMMSTEQGRMMAKKIGAQLSAIGEKFKTLTPEEKLRVADEIKNRMGNVLDEEFKEDFKETFKAEIKKQYIQAVAYNALYWIVIVVIVLLLIGFFLAFILFNKKKNNRFVLI